MELNEQFDQFMQSPINNKWIGDNNIQIYVRKAFHTYCGKVIQTIDIANIQQTEESKGKGYFREFMQHIETYGITIYIENILNPKLTVILIKNGYEIIFPEYDKNFEITSNCAIKFPHDYNIS